jgi:dephospho-CoA kinase
MLIFIRGLPGSGKTSLANELTKKLTCTIVDPDNIKNNDLDFTKFCKENYNQAHHKDAILSKKILYRYNFIYAKKQLANNKIVLWVQPWSLLEGIYNTIQRLEDCGLSKSTISPLVLDITISYRIALIRVSKRYLENTSYISPASLDRDFFDIYQHTNKKDLMIPVIKLNGNKCCDILAEEAYSAILRHQANIGT